MKNTISIALLSILATISTVFFHTSMASEKPVKHLVIADITSYEDAKKVIAQTTSGLKSKTKLNAEELHQIHMITYSLEKAVAYFVEHTQNEQQAAAVKIAEVVELIHLGSENNRSVETKIYLTEYFKLEQLFTAKL